MYGKSTVERDVEPERTRMQNSINQLDSLLDDLQQVKKSSYSEKGINNNFLNDFICLFSTTYLSYILKIKISTQ